jgi:hypothetical protein
MSFGKNQGTYLRIKEFMNIFSVNRSQIEAFLTYFALALFVVNSGSLYPICSKRALPWFLAMFAVSFMLFLVRRKTRIPNDFRILYLMVLAILLLIHRSMFSVDSAIYYGLIVTLLSAYFLGIAADGDKIQSAYINIAFFLALTSFTEWFLHFIHFIPLETFRIFPDLIVKRTGTHYYNYLFLVVDQYMMAERAIPRNPSIFWEGGVFQIFLNLALIMNISNVKKLITFKNVILFLALLSTFSTTGYFIFVLILFGYLKDVRKQRGAKIAFLIPIMVTVFFIVTSDVVVNKITFQSSSFTTRIADDLCDVQTFLGHPLWGCGVGNIDYKSFPFAGVGSSGLTSKFAEFGLFLALFYLIPAYFFKTRYSGIIWAAILTLMLQTEDMSLKPLYVMLILIDKNALLTHPIGFKIRSFQKHPGNRTDVLTNAATTKGYFE